VVDDRRCFHIFTALFLMTVPSKDIQNPNPIHPDLPCF
jgi:hypothetical protein